MDPKVKVDILKLITLVKKYPCILDPQKHAYNCTATNKVIWKIIDDKMGVPFKTCRRIWDNLKKRRVAFRAYQKRLANTPGPDCRVSWQWEKEMSFLNKYEDETCHTPTVDHEPYYETKEQDEYFRACALDDDKLIECVKNYPILTEIFNDSDYEKKVVWSYIANKMGCSAKCCQDGWKDLTRRYRKELWSHKKGISSNWEHFHKMDFAKIYVSFNMGNTSFLKDQSTVIFRYFNKLGKFLEKVPKEKRAELDDQILNLILEGELNSYSCVPKDDFEENVTKVVNSAQSNLSENGTTTSILGDVQPTNKYIVKIVPDGETSLENISEEYEINFLPDDYNIDAPLIECQVDEPAEVREQEQENGEIKEEIEDTELKEELEAEEIKEELVEVEIKEELEDVEIKEEVEDVEEKEELQEEVESMETKKDESVEIQEVEYVETQEEAENIVIQEEVESIEVKEEVETMEEKGEIESMEVKEAVEINEEIEGADIIKVLVEEDEEMVGCYVIEVTDE